MKQALVFLLLVCLPGVRAWADCLPDAAERDPAFPSADQVKALIGSSRIICKALVYLEETRVDTGRAFEAVLRFRDEAGRRYFILPETSSGGRFLPLLAYGLEFRFVGRTPTGMPLAVQSPNPPRRPYEGDIRERDARLEQVKEQLRKGEATPATLRLRYGGTRNDYAIFYDLVGREILYRYREDRFDRRSDKKVRGLIEGQAYQVSGQFLGARLKEVLAAPGSGEYMRFLADEDSTLEYDFGAALPLRLEQILLQ